MHSVQSYTFLQSIKLLLKKSIFILLLPIALFAENDLAKFELNGILHKISDSNFIFDAYPFTTLLPEDRKFDHYKDQTEIVITADYQSSGVINLRTNYLPNSDTVEVYKIETSSMQHIATLIGDKCSDVSFCDSVYIDSGNYAFIYHSPNNASRSPRPIFKMQFFPEITTVDECVNLENPAFGLSCQHSWFKGAINSLLHQEFDEMRESIKERIINPEEADSVNQAWHYIDTALDIANMIYDAKKLKNSYSKLKNLNTNGLHALDDYYINIVNTSSQDLSETFANRLSKSKAYYAGSTDLKTQITAEIVDTASAILGLFPPSPQGYANAAQTLAGNAVTLYNLYTMTKSTNETAEVWNSYWSANYVVAEWFNTYNGNLDNMVSATTLDDSSFGALATYYFNQNNDFSWLYPDPFDPEKASNNVSEMFEQMHEFYESRNNYLMYIDVDGDGYINANDPYPNDPSLPVPPTVNNAPNASFTLSKTSANVGDTITATSTSSDPDGDALTYQWKLFKPDGSYQYISSNITASFEVQIAGRYTLSLNISDTNSVNSSFTKVVTVANPTQTYFDPERIDVLNVPVGSNRCGDVVQLASYTLQSGEYWDGPKLWATTYDSEGGPYHQFFLISYNTPPSPDRSYSDSVCSSYEQTSTRGFNYDFVMDMFDGTILNNGNVNHSKNLDRLVTPGTTVYIAIGISDNYPFEVKQATLQTNVLIDRDGDGIKDSEDDFPDDPNKQYDTDNDGIDDKADKFPNDIAASIDTDDDGYPDSWNSGKTQANSTTGLQLDQFPTDKAAALDDGDGYPDQWNNGKTEADSTTGLILDLFPGDASEWADDDSDGVGNNADPFDDDPTEWADSDGDLVGDNADVAPTDASRSINAKPQFGYMPNQYLLNETSKIVDINATDPDGDTMTYHIGFYDANDASVLSISNNQLVVNGSAENNRSIQFYIEAKDSFNASSYKSMTVQFGEDQDSDGIIDSSDICPLDPENDSDNDYICGNIDNCSSTFNSDQNDTDGDGIGDACDVCSSDPLNDDDNDGFCYSVDNCPLVANADQSDSDRDGVGDVCDATDNMDDGVSCTIDTWDGQIYIHTPDDSQCDDSLWANGSETCDTINGCQNGTPVICDDSDPYTADFANEVTDSCDHLPDSDGDWIPDSSDANNDDGPYANPDNDQLLNYEDDDDDNDGMPDSYEQQYSNKLNQWSDDANSDADSDGVSNIDEMNANTNPTDDTSYPESVNNQQLSPSLLLYILH